MFRCTAKWFAIATIIILSNSRYSFSLTVDNKSIDTKTKQKIINWVCDELHTNYVFPDSAAKMTTFVQKQFAEGEYDSESSLKELASRLDSDLRSICSDLHLRIKFMPNLPPPDTASKEEKENALRENIEIDRQENFYFKEIKHLPDNVGYLRFDEFIDPKYSGSRIASAMRFLADCDALIIDLRYNRGGESEMVRTLLSYFFDSPIHYNSFYIRKEDMVEQSWTSSYVEGPKLTDVDLYVLTSEAYTFSAAEGFAFCLQNFDRATVVGETTSGGAHAVDFFYLREYMIALRIPTSRSYDPQSGLNWEGVGIEPDVKTSAREALDTAYRLALQNFIRKEEQAHLGSDVENPVDLESLGIEFVRIEGGSFQMGDTFGEGRDSERPVHAVTLDDFYMSKTEVTFAQYDRFCEATGRPKPDDGGWGRGKRPVINVNWNEAIDFCLWVSLKTDREIRLPSEAEWEYAAREGGKERRFGNGNDIANPAEINFDGSEEKKTAFSHSGKNRKQSLPVACLRSNALDLFDMSGNVWEWTNDWYDEDYYANGPVRNPTGSSADTYYRIIRGGGWKSSPRGIRCSTRGLYTPDGRDDGIGFRLAMTR